MKFKALDGHWFTVMVYSFFGLMLAITGTRPPSTPAAEWLINLPLVILFVFSWIRAHEETKASAEEKYDYLKERYFEVLNHAQEYPKKLPVEDYRGYFIRYNFECYAVYADRKCKGDPIVAYDRDMRNGKSGMWAAKLDIDELVEEAADNGDPKPESDQPT
jgi:hypothetical protein